MKQKTAMQTVVDVLENVENSIYDIHVYIQMHKNELLEKEKQQIQDAWTKGEENWMQEQNDADYADGEEYFNQTYGNNDKK